MTARTIIWPDDDDRRGELGGKAGALATLADHGLPIPPWFVISPQAFRVSAGDEERAAAHNRSANSAIDTIPAVHPTAPVRAEIADALQRLAPDGGPFAVRSSGGDEDSAGHSFAGQFDSFLFVSPEDVSEKVAAVWASGFSERVLAYRREHGLPPGDAPAVLVQRMIDADAAGVAFSVDPVTGRRDVAVVSAVLGLGSSLVSGEADADAYHVDANGRVVERTIAYKTIAHRADASANEGVSAVRVEPSRADAPAITDAQAARIATLTREAAQRFGRAQDIEWALKNDELYLLQSRPITSLGRVADAAGRRRVWDNANIAESYSGVTTPLTFSFARHIYEHVYRQFCLILSVPPAKVRQSHDVFANMLGLVRGRIYYNLLNWYRVLALLPGFEANRRFMEQMMGVSEAMPDDVLDRLKQTTWRSRLRDRLSLGSSVIGLWRQHATLPTNIERFYARLNEALDDVNPPLSDRGLDGLAAYYRELEAKLLTRWDAPLVNDFLAMIYFGVLGRLTQRWCGDAQGTLHNNLLCGGGGIISTEPAQRIREMAAMVASRGDADEVIAKLCAVNVHDVRDVRALLADHDDLQRSFDAYLERFGDRCLEELKLESPTLRDDPGPLLRSIGHTARRVRDGADAGHDGVGDRLRADAERKVADRLGAHVLRRIVFRWVLRHARDRVRDRENLRFERTRLFGRVRQLFLEMGRRLCEAGRLDDPRDVFHLEVGEVIGFVEGTTSCTDLRGLVAVRRAEFGRYRESEPAPGGRFETLGAVHVGNRFEQAERSDASGGERDAVVDGDVRRGIGCCPGVVRGRARVITDPRCAAIEHGEILVASRTDPGWIMLFPAAAGVVVEYGSLLSHSAIVAREMGIPAVVSVPGLMAWLRTGDAIELDGAGGVVRRREAAP